MTWMEITGWNRGDQGQNIVAILPLLDDTAETWDRAVEQGDLLVDEVESWDTYHDGIPECCQLPYPERPWSEVPKFEQDELYTLSDF